MTTIDVQAGLGRWMLGRAERAARRRRTAPVPTARIVRFVLQVIGLGWLDLAAWTLGRTVGYLAIGSTFILVAAMITGRPEGDRR